MKIYKFKDLSDENIHAHFLQIVLQNTIWCAKPDSLNDDEEFKFKLDYRPTPNTLDLFSRVIAQYRTTNFYHPYISVSLAIQNNRLQDIAGPIIDDLILDCRNTIGIISFSTIKNDSRLWEMYGGFGNGVCVEINIPDSLIGQSYHKVHYAPEKIFHVDSFLESALYKDKAFETYRNILLTKTKEKWVHEEEMRFIGNRQEVNLILDGYISEVMFGANVPEHILNKLMAAIADHCSSNKIRIITL
jgi:hypothetical protein